MKWSWPNFVRRESATQTPTVLRSPKNSGKPPPRRDKKTLVPPPLRVAMATLKTGDFIFDPDGGR